MSAQLLITFIVASPFVFISSFESYLNDENRICFIVVPLVIVVAVGLQFIPQVLEENPQLIVATTGLTIGEGVSFGIVAATFDLNALLLLPTVAAAVTFLLCIYSLQRKIDYNLFFGFLLCFIMAIVGTVIVFLKVDFRDEISTIACGAAAGIFAFYFAYDIQRLACDLRCQLNDLMVLLGIPLKAYFDIVHLVINAFDSLAENKPF